MIKIRDVIKQLDRWIPAEAGWDKDNTGFQIGDTGQEIRKILICLDLTPKVLQEALVTHSNLIISHHPLLFHPITKISPDTPTGTLLYEAVRHNITVYSAHTNLDFIFGGVSTVLARKLGLAGISLLDPHKKTERKLEVYVPKENLDSVHEALSEAGAGMIGNYTHCSFSHGGTGTFRGNEFSSPVTGSRLTLEKTEEVKLEMIYPFWAENRVFSALRASHPYEEIAYQILQTENQSAGFGAGCIGTLPEPMRLEEWAEFTGRQLQAKGIRFSGNPDQTIRKAAVCGGAGSDLIGKARAAGADCLVTADIRYHQFFLADESFSILDAGHYETEVPALGAVRDYLQIHFPEIPADITEINTNPIHYHFSQGEPKWKI